MIAHLVLFHPRPELSSEDRRELGQAFLDALQNIPSIRHVRIGPRVRHGRSYEQLMAVDYTYAAILEFDDLAGLRAYLEHPVHEQLAARFFAAFEHALMYDFDVQEGEASVAALLERPST